MELIYHTCARHTKRSMQSEALRAGVVRHRMMLLLTKAMDMLTGEVLLPGASNTGLKASLYARVTFLE